jgi:hypothetical protein
MTAGFLFLTGLFFLWVAFTGRSRDMWTALTGIQVQKPNS